MKAAENRVGGGDEAKHVEYLQRRLRTAACQVDALKITVFNQENEIR